MPFFVGAADRVETLRAGLRTTCAYRASTIMREVVIGASCARSPALRDSQIPVLAIAGEHDRGDAAGRRAPDRRGRAARRARSSIKDTGHFPFAEDPEAYWGGIQEWLAR